MRNNVIYKRNDSYQLLLNKQCGWDNIKSIVDQLNVDFDKIEYKDKDNGIILFGVGIYGEIVLQFFRRHGVNVLYYCDNDVSKQGKVIDGIKVISPRELTNINYTIVVITARHYVEQISKQLNEMNINNISFDTYFVKKMLHKYEYVYSNLLKEKRSREIYIQIIKSLILGTNKYCKSIMEGDAFYAIPEFTNTGNEIFVDAGAYVGDTVEQFVWKNIGAFKKIYAFEPGERQYTAMQHRIKRLIKEWCLNPEKIVCIKAGLGEKNSILSYSYNEKTPLGNNFISNNGGKFIETPIYSLDNFIDDENISFIKADIEGFEMEMLKGACNLIKKCKPKLAISVYHKPEDLFNIAEYIYSLVPEYKMAIRHHSPMLVDTVLYCWI